VDFVRKFVFLLNLFSGALGCSISQFSFGAPFIVHCYEGFCPVSGVDEPQFVVRHLYALEVATRSGRARWVGYQISAETIGVASLLPRKWFSEPLLDVQTENIILPSAIKATVPDLSDEQDRDYRLTETITEATELGRITPFTSFAGTPYWNELNILSNQADIPSTLRLGPWSRLDQALNERLAPFAPVFVVSGPIFQDVDKEYSSGFFKVVIHNERYAVFVFEFGTSGHADYCASVTSLEALKVDTGLSFFRSDSLLESGLEDSLGCV
jgi:endonuclease G